MKRLVWLWIAMGCGSQGPQGDPGAMGAMGPQGPMGEQGSGAPALVSTVIVSPGSTATSSGTALMAALGGIGDASATKPYLLKLEPGIYDLGAATLNAKDYVDIEGSGVANTVIQAELGTAPALDVGVGNVEIRELSIVNSDAATGGVVVTGIYLHNDVTPHVKDVAVTVTAKSSSTVLGIEIDSKAGAQLDNLNVTVSTTTASNNVAALSATNSGSSVRIINIARSFFSATSSGAATLTFGVLASGTAMNLDDSNVKCSAATGSEYALYLDGTGIGVRRTFLTAVGSITRVAFNGTTPAATTENWVFRDSLFTGNIVLTGAGTSTASIANSQITGSFSKGASATFHCFSNYDSTYAAVACP